MQNKKAADNILRFCVPKLKALASIYHPFLSSSETMRCDHKNDFLLMNAFSTEPRNLSTIITHLTQKYINV
jgi:hypothetical protein